NPRDVEQILDQSRHMLRLAVDDVRRPCQLVGTRGARAQNFDRVTDWAEGIAQLVGEEREELVLLAVGVPELALHPLLLGDVTRDLRRADDLPIIAANRRNREGNIEQTAVFRLADGFEMLDALAAMDAVQNRGLLVPAIV